MSHKMVMALVMAVPMITWVGVFAYLVMIDRTLRGMEQEQKEQDDL